MHPLHVSGKAQRGISLIGLIFVLAILGMGVILAFKAIPAYAEYISVYDAIKAAKATGGTVREMQLSFDKNADVNDIEVLSGRDLVISKETGATEISFAYEKRIPLAGNVSLLVDFSGSTGP